MKTPMKHKEEAERLRKEYKDLKDNGFVEPYSFWLEEKLSEASQRLEELERERDEWREKWKLEGGIVTDLTDKLNEAVEKYRRFYDLAKREGWLTTDKYYDRHDEEIETKNFLTKLKD